MASTNPGFEVVGGTEVDPPAPQATAAHIAMLKIALTALSQRAAIAVMDAFTLITCTGAWYLWYLTPNPNYQQIIHNSLFAVFVLAANWIVRGRK